MDDQLHEALLELETSLKEIDNARKMVEDGNKNVAELANNARAVIDKSLESNKKLTKLFDDWIQNLKKDTNGIVENFNAELEEFKQKNKEFGDGSAALIKKLDLFVASLQELKISEKLDNFKDKVDELKTSNDDFAKQAEGIFKELKNANHRERFNQLDSSITELQTSANAISQGVKEVAAKIDQVESKQDEFKNIVMNRLNSLDKKIHQKQVVSIVLLAVILILLGVSFFF
jgi:DNA repair exonuclease SbcCD ATPase subunit